MTNPTKPELAMNQCQGCPTPFLCVRDGCVKKPEPASAPNSPERLKELGELLKNIQPLCENQASAQDVITAFHQWYGAEAPSERDTEPYDMGKVAFQAGSQWQATRQAAQVALQPPTEFFIKNESSASVEMSGDGKTLVITDATLNVLPGQCSLRRMTQQTNPPKLVGFDIIDASGKLIGTASVEEFNKVAAKQAAPLTQEQFDAVACIVGKQIEAEEAARPVSAETAQEILTRRGMVCDSTTWDAAPSDLHAAILAIECYESPAKKDSKYWYELGHQHAIDAAAELVANAAPVSNNAVKYDKAAQRSSDVLSNLADDMVAQTAVAVPQYGASDNRPAEAFKYAHETVERNLAPALYANKPEQDK